MTSFTESLYLERREPCRKMARYNALSIERDLFNGVLAVRRWGRIGTRGREISIPCLDRGTALAILSVVEASKRKRGYVEPLSYRGRAVSPPLPSPPPTRDGLQHAEEQGHGN